MNVNEIQQTYKTLNNELREAVSHMERSDRLFVIRQAIKELQNLCPHENDNYNFTHEEQCPYCGKRCRG